MRVLIALVLVAFASATLAEGPAARDRGAGRRLLEAGKKAFTERNYQDAQRYFDAAFHRDPNLSIALYNRAFALRKLKRWASCAATYRKYLERAPDDLDAIFGLAECERGRDDVARASHLYGRYLERETRASKKRLVARARAYLEANPQKKAVELKTPVAVEAPATKEPVTDEDEGPTTSRLSRLLGNAPPDEPALSPKLGKLLKSSPKSEPQTDDEDPVSPKLAALFKTKRPKKAPTKNVGQPIAARIFTTPIKAAALPKVEVASSTTDGPSPRDLREAEVNKENAIRAAADGDLATAGAAAQAALAITPANYELLMIVGRARAETEPKSALPVFQRAVAIAADRAAPLLALAAVHRALGARDVENYYLRLFLKHQDPKKDPASEDNARRRLEDP